MSNKGVSKKKKVRLIPYPTKSLEPLNDTEHYTITHILRGDYKSLCTGQSRLANFGDAKLLGLVPVQVLFASSINEMDIDGILEADEKTELWITLI